MKKQWALYFLLLIIVNGLQAQTSDLQRSKDSTLRARIHEDSVMVNKEYARREKWEHMSSRMEFPLLNEGTYSGIIPVNGITEIPDPAMEYKILFELTANNDDSDIGTPNKGLVEIARIINLHVASGIPPKKIMPVLVVHAGALNALKNNKAFQTKYKIENPSIKLLHDLEKLGTKIIACGQAMSFLDIQASELLPEIKVSLTAQTVLTGYQLKGYVWRHITAE